MKIKTDEIFGKKLKSGETIYEWQGSGKFAMLSNRLLEGFGVFRPQGKLIFLNGLALRVVSGIATSDDRYYDAVIVMRESLSARFLAKYFQFAQQIAPKVLVFERKWYLANLVDGELLPKTSLTRLLYKTLPIVANYS